MNGFFKLVSQFWRFRSCFVHCKRTHPHVKIERMVEKKCYLLFKFEKEGLCLLQMPNNVLILHVLVRLRREKSFVQTAVVLPILPKLDNANVGIPAAVGKSRWSGTRDQERQQPREARLAIGGTMLSNCPTIARGPGLFYALLVGIVLMIPNFSLASDSVGTQALQSSADNVAGHDMQVPRGHRIIQERSRR